MLIMTEDKHGYTAKDPYWNEPDAVFYQRIRLEKKTFFHTEDVLFNNI